MSYDNQFIDNLEGLRKLYTDIVNGKTRHIAIDTEFNTYIPEYAQKMAEGSKRKPRVFAHDPNDTQGMSVCAGHHTVAYIAIVNDVTVEACAKFVMGLVSKGFSLWGWNWKAEWRALGITPEGNQYKDAMVLAHLLEEGVPFYDKGKLRYRYGLKEVAKHLLGVEMKEFKEIVSGKVLVSGLTEEENKALYDEETAAIHAQFAPKPPTKKALNEARKNYNKRAKACTYRKKMVGDVDPREVCDYACDDAMMTWKLASHLMKVAKEYNLVGVFNDIEVPITRITYAMEQKGVAVDVPFFEKTHRELLVRLEDLERRWNEKAGCKISSAPQCAHVLYTELACWPITASSRTTKGSLAVNKRALAVALDQCPEGSLGRELALIKQEHGKLHKLVNSYMKEFIFQGKYSADGRVHAQTKQTGTNTGRFSMNNPNLQSTPKDIVREGLVAPEGRVFVCADWSSLEIVVMGHFSKDAAIAEIVLSGRSQHDVTAEGVGVERSVAKTLNFGLNYGGGANTIARSLNVPLEPMVLRNGKEVMVAPKYIRDWVKKYKETYEGVVTWRDAVATTCCEKGYVTTLLGRRRKLPGIYSMDDGEKAGAERTAYNTPIQGTAAEIAKVAMVRLDTWLRENKPTADLLLQVHDELIVECDTADGEDIKKAMEIIMSTCIQLDLPLKAEVHIGSSWKESKK
jgi:DNA polymerase I-like protein with 3'-5' exonuclease and polymerase domains